MTCVHGGYKALSPIQICNALSALQSGQISLRAFRTYFACAALVATRDAARRVALRTRSRPGAEQPRNLV